MPPNVHIITISGKTQQDNITITGICPDFKLNNDMCIYILFVGVLIVFVWVVTWFVFCYSATSGVYMY